MRFCLPCGRVKAASIIQLGAKSRLQSEDRIQSRSGFLWRSPKKKQSLRSNRATLVPEIMAGLTVTLVSIHGGTASTLTAGVNPDERK